MRPSALRRLAPAFLLAAAFGLPRATAEDPPTAPEGLARIRAHRISARFDLDAHRVVATDVLEFDTTAGRRVALALPSGKIVTSEELAIDGNVGRGRLPPGKDRLEVTYSTEIFDGVRKKDDLSWVVGDATTGLVSEKGIYLTGASGWYPQDAEGEPRLARFDVTTWVPEPFLVVTQGRVPERSRLLAPRGWTSDDVVVPPAAPEGAETTAYAVSSVVAQLPTDDLALSAGPYVTSSRTVQGIEVSTYFFAGEADAAPLWLEAMDEVITRYESRLGTYPHPKFDIVENFFQSGYGMPSYTLLGDEVIRYVTAGAKASGKIPPGYLDHEYVHGWFGNGLFVDLKDGNWCEAATTYFSNYLAKELDSPEAGREARRATLEKYALRVTPETDYPVRSFRSKTEDKDNDVGYGKGSLVFHTLRRRLGDAEFFARTKRLAEDRVGTFVSWTDWLAALDGDFAKPYLERTGLPGYRLASATRWPGPKRSLNSIVRVEVVLDAPRGEALWPAVDVPVAVDGEIVGTVRVEGRSGVATWNVDGVPRVAELDPGFDLLRRIPAKDLPACLNRTIETKGAVVRRRGADAIFGPLAARLAGEKKLEAILPGSDPAASDGRPAVDLIVLAKDDRFTFPAGQKHPRIVVDPEGIVVDGKRMEGKDLSILVSSNTDAGPRTWFLAMTEAAAGRAKMLPYYGWDTFAVFDATKRTPIARGRLDDDARATRRAIVGVDGSDALDVLRDVEWLASEELEGRRPGTAGAAKARAELARRLDVAFEGVTPAATPSRAPFPLGVADLVSSRDLHVTTKTGTVVLKDAFRALCASPARAKGTPLELGEGTNPVPLPGRIPDTTPAGLARLWRQVEHGVAPALLLLPSPEARKALAPLVDAPNALTAESEAELAAPGRGGAPRPRPVLAPWIASRRTKAFPGLRPLRVPVLLITDEAYTAIFERMKDVVSVDFEVAFGPEKAAAEAGTGGENVLVEWLPPGLAAERPPVVVVCAHYDSFGRDGERFLAGADDNATGVACVLRALVGAKETLAGAKRGLVVVFFDGEEWGLAGSRALAPDLAKKYDVKAVVNVDSVGRVKDDEVHVVGLSTHPELGKAAGEALAGAGLRTAADIDKYAYSEGSDHWPFHEAGAPAITFWASDYGTMNTAADDVAKVDPVGVTRLSGALRALLRRLVTSE